MFLYGVYLFLRRLFRELKAGGGGERKHNAYEKRRDLLTLTIHTPAATVVPRRLKLNNTQHLFPAYYIYAFGI